MQATLFRGVKGIKGLGKKLKKGGKKDPDSISIGYPKVDFDREPVEAASVENDSDDGAESLYDEVEVYFSVLIGRVLPNTPV